MVGLWRAPRFWERRTLLGYLLVPLSYLYRFGCWLRHAYYQCAAKPKPQIPIVVVGNLTVGGAGKTPLVAALAAFWAARGYRPGIISRGYGGRAGSQPILVTPASSAAVVGDEALLLARQTRMPVVVTPDRWGAVNYLRAHTPVDLIISDDGLQHYALRRDLELLVVDQVTGFGNGWCLPAGPLREPKSRLGTVDLVVTNYNTTESVDLCGMNLEVVGFRKLTEPLLVQPPEYFCKQPVYAVAGIGQPQRFFQTLKQLGLKIIPCPFPDHYHFSRQSFANFHDQLIVMTEKDAVKCEGLGLPNCWCLMVRARLAPALQASLLTKIPPGSGSVEGC